MFTGFSAFRSTCFTLASVLILLISLATTAQAARNAAVDTTQDGVDDVGYDTIVRDLTHEADRPAIAAKAAKKAADDPLASVLFHGGVGGSILAESMNVGGKSLFLNQKGLQVALGIDLFSPHWMAEGTYRNFGDSETQSVTTALQEFELKMYYRDRISGPVALRVGGGLSARYFSVHGTGLEETTYSTPSAVATAALDFFINDKLSVGTDLSARSAMVSDTPDQSSLDFTLRVDAHF